MIDIYVHTIYFTNGDKQIFDSDKAIDFPDNGLCKINFTTTGSKAIINMAHVNTINIKHLTLTEEDYQRRQELLSNKA